MCIEFKMLQGLALSGFGVIMFTFVNRVLLEILSKKIELSNLYKRKYGQEF